MLFVAATRGDSRAGCPCHSAVPSPLVPGTASNRASLPEVVETAAILVDLTDPEALASTMQRVLSDEALRRRLIDSGGERVKLFSARESALQHLEVYREAIRS